MTPGLWTAVLAALASIASVIGGYLTGAYRVRAELATSKKSAEHVLIDQLQEELARYRERTDARLDELEVLVRSYREFIGVQRDHMAEHRIPIPPWPEGLPR